MDVSQAIARHRAPIIVAAALVPLVAGLVLSAFRDDITAATAVLVLVLVIVAAASTGLRLAGIVAALSSGAWFDFFLTEPYGRFAIDDPQDIEAAVLLVLIGVAVTEVALWGHRQQARASTRAGYLDGVLGTVELVTVRHETPDKLLHHISQQLEVVLGVDQARFVGGAPADSRFAVIDKQGFVTRGGHPLNVERDGLPTDEYTALVVTRGDLSIGHFLFTAATDVARPSLEQRKVAILLADQAGSVVGNQTL